MDDDFYDLEDRDDETDEDDENAWDPEVNPPYFNDPMIPLPGNNVEKESSDVEQIREFNNPGEERPAKQVREFDHQGEEEPQ